MHNWYALAVVSMVGLFTACAPAPQIPIVDTEAAPKTAIATKTNLPGPPMPEQVAMEPKPIEEGHRTVEPSASNRPPLGPHTENSSDGHHGHVEGGVEGGVFGGILRSIQGGSMLSARPISGISSGSEPPLPDGVLRIDDPRLVQKRCPPPGAPQYPQAAKDAKVEARIMARCIVETNGTLNDCKLLKSHPLFDKPMLDHLKKAQVTPMTTTDGKAARVLCYYNYRFKLQ
jgi:periplasmic protein TonB